VGKEKATSLRQWPYPHRLAHLFLLSIDMIAYEEVRVKCRD
jgi:hypothetical protein